MKSVSPDPSTHFCPLPFNFNQISFEFENVSSNEVEFRNATNLSIANLAQTSTSVLRGDFSFSDQWQQTATVEIWVKQNSSNYWKDTKVANYTFPHVRSLLSRNIFNAAPNSKTIIAPICPTTVNIKFDKIKYVRLGGKVDNNNDLFSEVSSYEYLLPAGVTPLSGLTPAPGLLNTYIGNNDVFVTVTHPFNNVTIQVRATNTFCSQAVKGNFNNIFIQRQLPTLNGPNSIRCGETDTKTFQVVNLPTTNNCITTYTWQIANKGWKYNGTIPTNNIVTTTPNIQLVSADNLNNPPQSVSVVIANATNQSYTATRNVTFIAPSITINPILSANFDCNALDFTANVINPPLSSFNYIWSSTGAPGSSFINFLPAPQTTITNTATISRDPNYTDPISINSAVNASCGIIYSSFYSGFNGCFPWSSFTVYGFTDPLNGGGNIVANIQGIPEATEYEWFSFYYNQYHYLTNTYGDYLQVSGYGFPSVDEIGIFVRAKTPSGNTELKFVGSFCNSSGCGGYRTAINGNNNANQIKVFPNPANTIVTVSLQTKILIANSTIDDELSMKVAKLSSKKEVISKKNSPLQHLPTEITQIKVMNSIGLMQKVVRFGKGNKTVDFSVNDLKDGIYMLEITDGKNTSKTPLIIKR